MKKLLYILPALFLGSVLFASCNTEVDDLFDQSASQRMESRVMEFRELLAQPENGWAMEYYPGGSNQIYGGYALTVKFEKSGKCRFHSILANDLSEESSGLYSVRKDMGPTLNFDSYNTLFHYFSDPDISDGEGEGFGLEGDYEFVLESGNEKEIVMTGKKHGSVIRMYPLEAPAVSYLEKVKEIRKSYTDLAGVEGVGGTFGGEPVSGEIISGQHFMLTQGNESVKFSFMFTDKGLKLYQPITLNGKVAEDLIWNPEEKTFTSSNGVANLKLSVNPLGLRLDQLVGQYEFDYGNGKTDVEIRALSSTSAEMVGLPFRIVMSYSLKKGALELNAQKIKDNPEVQLAIWALPPGSLSWGRGYGLVTKWNGDKDHMVLELVDNGFEWLNKGQRIYANAFILWDVAKSDTYKGFGNSRFHHLKLTKK